MERNKSAKQSSSIPNLRVGPTEYKSDAEKVSLFSTILSETFTDNLKSSDFDLNFPKVIENRAINFNFNHCETEFFLQPETFTKC